MAYIGLEPSNSFVSLKRQVITGNNGASYTLDHSVASVNDVAIFVNNVRQDPASYSVSGTALTLGGTISSSDSCYVIFLGQALQTVTPGSDTITAAMLKSDSVTAAKINNDIISGSTELASEPADTDEFLVSDAGTLKRIDYSLIKGGGITMAQQWRLTSDLVGDANPVTSNLEVVDTDGYGGIGSSMSESSGVFTFPSTGIYLINFNINQQVTAGGDYAQGIIQTTTDNSSYSSAADGRTNSSGTGTAFNSAQASFMFDVTDTSTHKVSFRVVQANTGNKLIGNSSSNITYMTFIRLGDT